MIDNSRELLNWLDNNILTMNYLFIQTGGTIDKDYPHTTKGWAFEIDEPASKRILDVLNPSFDYEIITVCRKDSLELEDNDRQKIVDVINQHEADAYIITHGTDTMLDTANFLSARFTSKKIIITGAMLPERFTNSEASINLGTAIGASEHLKDGVYIAMHGVVKPWNRIDRDMTTGKYY